MNDADVLFPWEKHGGHADHHERDPDTADTAQAGPTTPDTADTRPAAGADDVHEEQAATDAARTVEQSAEAAPADTVNAGAAAETPHVSAADAEAGAGETRAPADESDGVASGGGVASGEGVTSGDDAPEDEARFAVLDTEYARQAAERASSALREKPVAQKEYYSISEVCDLVGLKPHVLRYWETQFQVLNPSKNRSGNRVYQRKEIRLITLVRHLLYEEKYTVEGAKAKLDQLRRSGDLAAAAGPVMDRVMIDQLRAELSELTTLLTPPART